MTPAQIADICDGRDKAIALWLGLYDTYHATRDEAARLTLGGPLSLSCGRDWTEDTLTRAFSCHRLSWRRLRRQAAALICRVWGLFLPLPQGLDRLRRCAAPLGDQAGFPALPSLRSVQGG